MCSPDPICRPRTVHFVPTLLGALLWLCACSRCERASQSADAGIARAGANIAPSPGESLPRPAKQLLCTTMQRHGVELSALMGAVTVLDWDGAAASSQRMLEEPTLALPLPNAAAYNENLP